MARPTFRWRTLKSWVLWSVVVLPLVWVWVLALEWLPMTSQPASDALALLERHRTPPVSGKNAFALFWNIDHTVSETEWDYVVAADAEAYRVADEEFHEFPPSARDEYPHSPAPKLPSCCNNLDLSIARRNRSELTIFARTHARKFGLITRLAEFDHYYDPLPQTKDGSYPGLRWLTLHRAHIASVSNTNPQQALGDLCLHIQSQRRLRTHSNSLLFSRYIEYNLFSDLQFLAELESVTHVSFTPSICGLAAQPLQPHDYPLCAAAANDHALIMHMLRSTPPDINPTGESSSVIANFLTELAYNRSHTAALSAQQSARMCRSDEEWVRLHGESEIRCSAWQYLFNPAGCHVLSHGGGALEQRRRTVQLDNRFRLHGVIRWMDRHLVIHPSLLAAAVRTLPAPQGELILDRHRDGLWQRNPLDWGRTWTGRRCIAWADAPDPDPRIYAACGTGKSISVSAR